MLSPNDGGIGRVIDYLKRAADPEHKHQRIAEQIAALAGDLMKLLSIYYRGDASADVELKVKRAQEIITALTSEDYRHDRFSELSTPCCRMRNNAGPAICVSIPWRATPSNQGRAARSVVALGRHAVEPTGGQGPDAQQIADPAAKPAPATSEQARKFANAVTNSWLAQLRDIPRSGAHVRYLDQPAGRGDAGRRDPGRRVAARGADQDRRRLQRRGGSGRQAPDPVR